MAFKLSLLDRIFVVSIIQIRINVKFKCQFDIFIKYGSQKEDLFEGLKINDCQVIFPNLKSKSDLKVISIPDTNNKHHKNIKKCVLTFQLRSKSYNAYAGQVEINLNNQKRTKYESIIQNCVDQQASIIYQVFKQGLQKSNSDGKLLEKKQESKTNVGLKKSLFNQPNKILQTTSKIEQSNILKKKTVTSVENQKYRLNFKNPQKSYLLNQNNRKYGSTMNGLNFSIKTEDKYISSNIQKVQEEIQLSSINKTKLQKSKSIQNSIQLNQKKLGRLLYSKTSTPQITKKIIQLQKVVYQQKQKSLKLQLQIQAYKNEIKNLSKQNKTTQKKYQSYQTQMKKIKKLQTSFTKQNQQLKQLVESLKHKLNEKTQQMNLMNQRIITKQKSFKQQLKNVYQKLQNINRQKQFKNHENINLEQKIQKYQRKTYQQMQEKNWFIECQKKKMEKILKKTQKECSFTKQFFTKSFKQYNKQIQQLLKKSTKNIFHKNATFQSMTLQTNTSNSLDNSSQFQWSKQFISLFKQSIIKIQRLSTDLHQKIEQKDFIMDKKQKQIISLKDQLRQLSMELYNFEQLIKTERQKSKNQIQKLQEMIQQQRKANSLKIKQLKQQIKDNECQIQQLNDGILIRNREISSLKILKQQLQQNIKKISDQMIKKTQQHNKYVDQILREKEKLSTQLRNQILSLQNNLQKQRIKTSQFKQQSIIFKKNCDKLQNQITVHLSHIKQLNQKNNQIQNQLKSSQNELKSVQQTNQLMTKDMNQLKNMINQITGLSSKKQKQMNNQNKQLYKQVKTFKQNYNALQQAKLQIQKNLQKLSSDLFKTREEKAKLEEDYQKINKVFNTTQKSSQTLKNAILDMKKENEELKLKLKKKQQFQAEIEDQFQCNFYQIRQKLIYFIQQNTQFQKQRNGLQRQNALKMKKFNQYIQSLTNQLNSVVDFQTKYFQQHKKLYDNSTSQFKKLFNQYQKQGVINSFYTNQFRQKFNLIEKFYQEADQSFANLLKSLEEPRKARAKNSTNLRKVSHNDSSINRTILRKSSSTTNLMTRQQLNKNNSPNYSQREPRKLIRNKSMITSFQALNKKKDQMKNDRIASLEDSLKKEPSNQEKRQILQNIMETTSQKLEEQQIKQKKVSNLKKFQSKIKNLQINKKMHKIQEVPQNYTPTAVFDQKKKGIKRMNTLK